MSKRASLSPTDPLAKALEEFILAQLRRPNEWYQQMISLFGGVPMDILVTRAKDYGYRGAEVREAFSRLTTAEEVEVLIYGCSLIVRALPVRDATPDAGSRE